MAETLGAPNPLAEVEALLPAKEPWASLHTPNARTVRHADVLAAVRRAIAEAKLDALDETLNVGHLVPEHWGGIEEGTHMVGCPGCMLDALREQYERERDAAREGEGDG